MRKGVIALALLVIIFIGYFFVVRADNKPEQPTVTENTQPQTPKKPTREELLKLINAERSKAGVAPLKIDPLFNQSAQYKADDMVKRNYYAHTDPVTGLKNGIDYAANIGGSTRCSYIGENFYSSNNHKAASDALDWWRNSKSHIDAIKDPRYTLTGFGISSVENDGTMGVIVEHFCITK